MLNVAVSQTATVSHYHGSTPWWAATICKPTAIHMLSSSWPLGTKTQYCNGHTRYSYVTTSILQHWCKSHCVIWGFPSFLSYFFIIDPTEYLSYKGPCICWLALFMVRFEVQYTIISLLCLLHLRSYVKQDTCFLALASQCSLAIVVVTVKLGGLCTEPHCHRDPALPPGCSTTTGL